MSESALSYDRLTVRYEHTKPVLNSVSLDIKNGSFNVILGASGCGKSTLLHATAGFIKPKSGKILLDNKPILGPSSEIGFVSQDHSLFPWLTVYENIAFGLRSRARGSGTTIEKEVDELLGAVGLSDRRKSFPAQLSGGMRQRVALARAMATAPRVLVLDEPFSALDIVSRLQMRDLLAKEWWQRRMTILFVTHDIEEAVYLGDRWIAFDGTGKVLPHDISLNRPREVRAAEFRSICDEIRNFIYTPATA